MDVGDRGCRFPRRVLFTTLCILAVVRPSPRSQIWPLPSALVDASPELIDRLRADPFTYFRFVNRSWAARVCEIFADVTDMPVVRLHGDAHVEQYAFTNHAWGLVDYDDSARGPESIDVVRFLGSIDLAARQRGWSRDRDALWDRFFAGYRVGLSDPIHQSREPEIVHRLRAQKQLTRAGFLAVAESQMQAMDNDTLKLVDGAMEALETIVRRDRRDLSAAYFSVKRAGWLRVGVGSGVTRKVLIRVEGATRDDGDDVILEAKEVTNLDGVGCVEAGTTPPALRVVDGTRQLGRLKHDILAVGPTLLIPGVAGRAERWLDWWVASWEPSYREVRITDLRSVNDLADIVYDSGVQLGSKEPIDDASRKLALSSVIRLEGRFRKETSGIVDELLAGWRELASPRTLRD
jgi:uncharacterized protein (DUF2252 family)